MKFIKQLDERDCGPVCLAMICRHYKKRVSVDKIRDMAHTNENGTNLLGMVNAGTALGLDMKAVRVVNEPELYNVQLPCIAHITNDEGYDHFVVIRKMTRQHVYIVDPAIGKSKESLNNFKMKWTRILLLVSKSENFSTQTVDYPIKTEMLALVKQYKSFILLIVFLSILLNFISFLGTFYFKFFIDDLIPHYDKSGINQLSIAIIGLYALHALIAFSRGKLMIAISSKLDVQLITQFFNHIIHLPMRFFESRKPGEIASRLTDIHKIRDAIASIAVTIFVDLLMIVVGAMMLAYINLHLFIIISIMIPLYVILSMSFKSPLKRYNDLLLHQGAMFNGYLIEIFNGILFLKSFVKEQEVSKKVAIRLEQFIQSYKTLGNLSNIQLNIKGFMAMSASVCVLWVGGHQVINGDMTLGNLITFNALVMYYFGPVERAIELQPMIHTALIAMRRVVAYTSKPNEIQMAQAQSQAVSFANEIRLSNVSFSYEPEVPILKEINITISKGTKVSIVGESGSGKSTLAKVLMGFYKVDQGDLYMDKMHYGAIDIHALRKRIGYLTQKPFFFKGSIIDNLTIDIKKPLDQFKMIEACKMAEIHHDIMSFPMGYATMVETEGTNLSSGQLQRLAIARALLHQTDILILDEATNALNDKLERCIFRNLQSLLKLNRTLIIMSHKRENIRDSDMIYVMHKGQVVESGTHDRLIETGVYYKRIYE